MEAASRDTPRPHIHAAGQIPRCFAMNRDLISSPPRSRRRHFFLDVALRLQPGQLAPQATDLHLLRLHLTVTGKDMARISGKLPHPLRSTFACPSGRAREPS